MIKHIVIPLHRLALRQRIDCLDQAINERHRGPDPASEDIAACLMRRNFLERKLRALDRIDTDRVVMAACAACGLLLGLVLVSHHYGIAPGWLS